MLLLKKGQGNHSSSYPAHCKCPSPDSYTPFAPMITQTNQKSLFIHLQNRWEL